MARPNESVVFEIAVEAARAKQELAEIGKSATTMGGALEKTSAMVERLRAKQLDLANALATAGQATQKDAVLMGALRKELEATTSTLNSFGGSQARVTQGLQGVGAAAVTTIGNTAKMGGSFDMMKGGLEKFDRAASQTERTLRQVQGAMGGANSKALEAVGAFGDVAGIIGGGGPLAIGLAAGTFAFVQIAKAVGDARQRSRDFIEAVTSMNTAVVQMTKASIQPSRDAIQQLSTELLNFGRDSRQIMIESAQMSVAALDTRSSTLAKSAAREKAELEAMRSKFNTDALSGGMNREERIERTKDLFVQMGIVDSIKKRAAATATVLEEEKGNLDKITRLALLLDANEAERERKRTAMAAASKTGEGTVGMYGVRGGIIVNAMRASAEAEAKAMAEAQKKADAQYKKDMAEQAAQLRVENDQIANEKIQQADALSHILTEIESDGIKERQRLQEQDLAFRTQIASQFIGIGVGATQQLLDAVITGQDHALERFGATMLKQAGTAVIGHGINALAGGLAAESLALAPFTAGQSSIVTGLGLIGAGLGMGGLSTGIEHSLAGGKIGSAAPTRGANDRGVNTGRAGAGGGGGRVPTDGGGFTLNVTFGAAGPAPEQMGREVERAWNSLLSRRGHESIEQGPPR